MAKPYPINAHSTWCRVSEATWSARRQDGVLLPGPGVPDAHACALGWRRVEKRPFRGSLTERRRLGFAATPVSRLFGRRVSRYADSVLMADDDRSRCRAVLELRVSRGSKVAATPPCRRASVPSS